MSISLGIRKTLYVENLVITSDSLVEDKEARPLNEVISFLSCCPFWGLNSELILSDNKNTPGRREIITWGSEGSGGRCFYFFPEKVIILVFMV